MPTKKNPKLVIRKDKLLSSDKNTIPKLIAMYSLEAYHSLPISLDMVQNTLLQEHKNDSTYQITTNNEPLKPMCPNVFDLKRIPFVVLIFMWCKLKCILLSSPKGRGQGSGQFP